MPANFPKYCGFGQNKAFTDNLIYDKLLNDKLSANLGYVYENVVAQMIRASGRELFYHTFPSQDGKRNYEIDFIISEQHKISPIEVKSSGYRAHASLDVFCVRHSSRIKNKYVVYTKDLYKEEDIQYIPVYMVPFIL